MGEAFLIGGVVCVVAWAYLLALHGGFWLVRKWVAPAGSHVEVSAPICVVIPARDEAGSIGRAVRSLLNQAGVRDIHLFIVDDNSADGTAEAARAAAVGYEPKLTVIAGRPLAPGWTGKLWAVQQGVEAALKLNPQFLLLTDADVEHAPDNLATLISIAERDKYDLVSFMVKLHCETLAEKLLIPAFVFFFFMLYPPEWIRSSRRKTAGAAGGCVLIRPEALKRAGGIPAIRSEIIDDCALARTVKRNGGKVWLGLTRDTQSLRSYETFGEVESMIARTAFNQLGHSTVILVGAVLGLALVYLLPVGLMLSGLSYPISGGSGTQYALFGPAVYLLMCIAYLPTVRFYGLSAIWALTLPESALFYICATIHSAVKYWGGRGGEWKGRAQDG